MDQQQLQECFRVVTDVARQAGEMIRAAWLGDKAVELKSSIADLVTETDQQVEKIIISSLHEAFPTHSFIGEESVAAGEKCQLTDNPTWVIDPIDGTTNFVHSFPYSAVSIALVVNKKVELGLVYNPIQETMYTARRGQGAYCNGTRIKVTDTQDMGKALVCTEFGSGRDPAAMDSKFRSIRSVINKVHGIRSVGSAAMSLAIVAAGMVDAYYETGIHAWDYAAGILLVEEAGGVVMDTSGGPVDLLARRVLCAGTEKLARQIADTIELLDMGRD